MNISNEELESLLILLQKYKVTRFKSGEIEVDLQTVDLQESKHMDLKIDDTSLSNQSIPYADELYFSSAT